MREEPLYTVGELAKKCGVSVRTLQFYDRIGLVSPGGRSEGGRRLYGRREIIRLHQAFFLKSLGFPLEEIRDKLMPAETAASLMETLKRQEETLNGQIRYLQDAVALIRQTTAEIERSGDIPLSSLMAITSAVQLGHSYAFVLKYFKKDDVEKMVGHAFEQENPFTVMGDWQAMIDRLMELHRGGVDPESAEGQEFAAQWWNMVASISGENPDFLKSALSAGEDIENWPDDADGFKVAIRDFVGKAIEKYIRDHGIQLPE
jgi:DNA-binding transcriptional MerR regulator